jgi:hypothetical protein
MSADNIDQENIHTAAIARAIRPRGYPFLDAEPEFKRKNGVTRSMMNPVRSFPPGFCGNLSWQSWDIGLKASLPRNWDPRGQEGHQEQLGF